MGSACTEPSSQRPLTFNNLGWFGICAGFLESCHFHDNTGRISGGALYLKADCEFLLKGKTTFEYNKAGAIYCWCFSYAFAECGIELCEIHLAGRWWRHICRELFYFTQCYCNNELQHYTKNRGGALFLNGLRSPIEMFAKSQLLLRRNKVLSTAGKGGAIFVRDTKKSCHSDCESLERECFLKVYSSNLTLVFDRNVATFGSILYGGLMDRCLFWELTTSDNIYT